MSLSLVVPASKKSFALEDPCPVCMDPLDRRLEGILGKIVIHDNVNGRKHPMHATCLKKSLTGNSHIGIGDGDCPVCRDPIQWPKNSLSDKITEVAIFILINAAAYGTFSYLTGCPRAVAAVPGLMSSIVSANSFRIAHKMGLLRRSLSAEIGARIGTAAVAVGAPVVASIVAAKLSESFIPQALMTATLGVMGTLPMVLNFLKEP